MPARISVVVPAFNLAGIIRATLRTVLTQTVLPDEVIVVDDGSIDGTLEEIDRCAEEFPAGVVRILHGSHHGPGAARNQGMAAAAGDWIAFLDGDDLWDATKIEKLRDFIAAHPGVTVIAHDEYERAPSGGTIYKPLHQRFDPSRPLLQQLYRANFLSTSCVAVRRELANSVGRMDETLPAAQDYDFWLKIARRGSLGFIPEPLETYVLRAESITSKVLTRYDCMVRIAFRHAPWVALETGAVRAWLLRIRYLVAMQKGLLQQSLRAGRSADSLRLLIRAPRHLLRALLSPLGKPS
jgi:glycosyltransferase involved in cell wall biosynthesis